MGLFDSDEEEEKIPLGESSDPDQSASENGGSDDEDESFGNFEDGSDSDSAPEMWSFSTMRESRQHAQELAAKAIKGQKEKLKSKRKELYLQNLKQREEKRLKIDSKRLPEELLERLSQEDNEVTKEPNQNTEPELTEDIKNDSPTEILKTAGHINFKCVDFASHKRKHCELVPKPTHFKDRMLYDSRIKREKSNRDAVLKRRKQHINHRNK